MRSAEATRALGRAVGARCPAGTVFLLSGPLGSGKTTFVQGLVEGLGAEPEATSPTFTLIHPHRGRLTLYHIDLYRLTPAEVEGLGLEELLGGEGVAAVEWPERLPERLQRGVTVRFAHGASESERVIEVDDASGGDWETAFAAAGTEVAAC